MRRRDFIALAGAATAAPRVAFAQQGKVPRVAFCSPAVSAAAMVIGGDANYSALLVEMERGGFVEGRTVAIERYVGPAATAAEVARMIVASAPDVIFWGGATDSARAALAINKTIPMVAFVDLVGQGMVANAGRPGGNITGVTSNPAPDLYGKMLALLRETVPQAKTIAYLTGGTAGQIVPSGQPVYASVFSAAAQLGVNVVPIVIEAPGSRETLAKSFDEVVSAKADGIVLGGEITIQFWSALEAQLALALRLPAISRFDQFAPAGGLLGYGPDFVSLSRQAGEYIALVLKGTKPGDLPVVYPTIYDLVVNLTTAKAIGITIPPTILAQATRVIE